ncbi:ATP-binding protein [Micromonospora peucetia]|uniref:ATP-binding protein n=1 Tax=Micromonospora peucetia TaxID=47871 RepID=A0ABZ1EJZ6_9ACTN|nr:ATP-binding protein [Micromonospora peucetia]WSA34587.1 ATP-binding protein [Micromonospora peucetia]
MGAEGRIAKVRKVDTAASLVWFDLLGGLSGNFHSDSPDDYTLGEVLFLQEGHPPERVDGSLWGASAEVGTVKHVADMKVVIEIDGKLRSFPQRAESPFAVGQSIEIDHTGQPGRKLADKPIDRLGIFERDDLDLETLIIEPGSNGVTLSDFGGSTRIVRRASDLVGVALDPNNRFSKIGAKPIKGMLFTGPSGTGKTFLAKGLANLTGSTFYNISGPAIVNQFVGQSERTLRKIFEHAAQNAPSILFFDEIDSLYTQRGAGNHESTNRLVGQFLSLLDGFTPYERVIVIATTNLPTSLDDALLRPGRLSHKLEFEIPDLNNRLAILQASSGNLQFSDIPDLHYIAAATDGWTAADLTAIWTEAAILAVLDRREALCAEDVREALPRVQRVSSRPERTDSNDLPQS